MTIFLPQARQELREAVAYYDTQQSGLGDRFLARVHDAIADIEAMPEAYSPLDGVYRKYGVRPFPYAVIYRVDGDAIVIVAVMHQKRKPGYWHDRLA